MNHSPYCALVFLAFFVTSNINCIFWQEMNSIDTVAIGNLLVPGENVNQPIRHLSHLMELKYICRKFSCSMIKCRSGLSCINITYILAAISSSRSDYDTQFVHPFSLLLVFLVPSFLAVRGMLNHSLTQIILYMTFIEILPQVTRSTWIFHPKENQIVILFLR